MTYQVNVGLAGGRLARGQGARIVACGFIGSVLALMALILPWYCKSCVQVKVIKKQEETILSLSRELAKN
jgi:hypothetical protein